jgi:hypothetical protein
LQIGSCVLVQPRAVHLATVDEAIRRQPSPSVIDGPPLAVRIESLYRIASTDRESRSSSSNSSAIGVAGDEVWADCRMLASKNEARLSQARSSQLWNNELLLLPVSMAFCLADVVDLFFCWFTSEPVLTQRDLEADLQTQLERALAAQTCAPDSEPYFCRYFFSRDNKLLPYAQAHLL